MSFRTCSGKHAPSLSSARPRERAGQAGVEAGRALPGDRAQVVGVAALERDDEGVALAGWPRLDVDPGDLADRQADPAAALADRQRAADQVRRAREEHAD